MYKWIYEELRAIERDRAKIDNRLWLLMQKVRHLNEKLEEDGIDRGELLMKSSMKLFGDYVMHTCNRCGNQWVSKLEEPKSCANRKCRSIYWNKTRVRYPKALKI